VTVSEIPPIRMSLGDGCSLAIYHELRGTPKPLDYNNLNFRIGQALEPMVTQMCADNGLDLYFTGDNQLEIAHDDPYRTGHPDGLARLENAANLTPWLAERLPSDALIRLLAGDMPVLEVKTLNTRNFKIFRDKGLDMSNSLMRKYYGQAQEYLHTLIAATNDELWESNDYRALLTTGKPRPSWILFVAFAKAEQEFCFRVIDADPEFYEKSNARIQLEVSDVLHRGEIPAPSYDGRSQECFFCPFKKLCPAYAGVAGDLLDVDDIPVVAPTDPKLLGHLDALAARYYDLGEVAREIKAERDNLRDQILDALEQNTRLYTSSFKVKHGMVKGRRNLDMPTLQALAKKHNFEIPYKIGEPASRLYVSALALEDDGDNTSE